MSFTLKTKELPIADRPPVAYGATVSAFELRRGRDSGNPYINVTLTDDRGRTRFDRIFLRDTWFAADFEPKKITDDTERKSFFRNVGARNRVGKLRAYLGTDFDADFNTVEELVATLTDVAIGKRFIALERQDRDRQTGLPGDGYSVYLYDPEHLPQRWPEGTRVFFEEKEAAE